MKIQDLQIPVPNQHFSGSFSRKSIVRIKSIEFRMVRLEILVRALTRLQK